MRFIDRTGQQIGDWYVVQRAESIRRNNATITRWLCRCVCGTERIVEGLNLGRRSRGCGCNRPGAPRLDVVTYQGLHERLRRERGKASAQTCVECPQPAHEWSLDRYEADDLIGQHGRSLVRYSLDTTRYVPRCRDHHRHHDAVQRRALVST